MERAWRCAPSWGWCQRVSVPSPPQLMIPAEVAHDTMVALGEVGMLQFKDLNPDKPAFQRTFANQVGRSAVG